MRRSRYKDLLLWKDKRNRKPLILNGARQVGESWLLNEFGKKEGRMGSVIFDPDYYLNKYPDVKQVYNNSKYAAYEHFINFGLAEGRQGCATFNVNTYMARYADLQAAYGTDLPSYYMHYLNYGDKIFTVTDTTGLKYELSLTSSQFRERK